MVKFAGVECTPEAIRGTISLLKYYRRFLRSDFDRCANPEDRYSGNPMTKAEARTRLGWLVDVAINRKAGLDVPRGRKDDPDYLGRLYRDRNRLHDIRNKRLIVRAFETEEARSRFSHLLTTEDDL